MRFEIEEKVTRMKIIAILPTLVPLSLNLPRVIAIAVPLNLVGNNSIPKMEILFNLWINILLFFLNVWKANRKIRGKNKIIYFKR